jgi:hypothetical protein
MATIQTEKIQEIRYPISVQYRNHWQIWEAIRELVQNALDASENYSMVKSNLDLIISDTGNGLTVENMFFGDSSKDSNLRGKFGEGLKIALIVLERLGLHTTIKSNNLQFDSGLYAVNGKQYFKLDYIETPIFHKGTSICIHDYFTKFQDMFADRFIIGNKDVEFEKESYGQILKNTSTSKLFVKDIYVSNLPDAAFSYNLREVNMEESRNVASHYSLMEAIGYIWTCCDSKELLTELLTAIEEHKLEQNANINASFDYPDALKEAFYGKYGKNAVLKTSEEMAREANHRGANVIECFSIQHQSRFFRILKTDLQYVQEDAKLLDIPVDENTLTDTEKFNLKFAREIARHVNGNDIKVYIMPNASGKSGCFTKEPIMIHKNRLGAKQWAMETTIHELVHAKYGDKDDTEEFWTNYGLIFCDVCLWLSINGNTFEAKLLSKNVGKYVQYCLNIPKDEIEKRRLAKGDKLTLAILEN